MTLEEILEDPVACFEVGMHRWRTWWYRKHLDQIIEVMTKDPIQSYGAGTLWKDKLFNRYADKIAESTANDIKASYSALTLWYMWKEERRPYLRKALRRKYSPECRLYKTANTKYELLTLVEFHAMIGIDAVSKLSKIQFDLATEAYEFAKQADSEKQFYKGLKESIEKGTVNKWAKTIIKYFRDASKGAGNYRMIEVTA